MKEKQTNEETIIALRKALLKRKYLSIFLALFTLGVNIFAWFVFTTTSSVGLDATVASWDVQFRDDQGMVMQTFVIDVTKMKPGMTDFNKTITVRNLSDVDADFIYEVTSFELLGHTIQNNNLYNYLNTRYPFSLTLNASKAVLNASDEVEFDIGLVWPYDSVTEIYYALDDAYQYDASLPYYQLSSGTYSLANVTDQTSYNSLKSGLYLKKDDADSYFGMRCNEYETSTGNACLRVNLRLLVQQSNAGA